MGYESRIYVVNVSRWNDGSPPYAEIIGTFNLCKMGYGNGWRELFDKPIDYKIYVGPNEETNKDLYGEIMKSGDYDKIVEWLETKGQKGEYRRIAPLLGMLKGFNRSAWRALEIVHYGY